VNDEVVEFVADDAITWNVPLYTVVDPVNPLIVTKLPTGTATLTLLIEGANVRSYVTVVPVAFPTATDRTVYSNAGAKFNPKVDKFTATTFAGTLAGNARGNVEMDDGTAILSRGTTAALSTFAGTSAKADRWTSKVTVTFKGFVTGSVEFDGSTAAVDCNISAAGGATASKLAVINNETAGTTYLTFTNTSGGISPATTDSTNIQASSYLYYKPSEKALYSTTFSGNATTANYADLAENYLADNTYEEGTVLIFGGEQEVTQSTVFNDRRVAGVVSLKPAYLMNNELVGEHVVAIALQGRVPVKVIGRVQKGDMLVTSGKPGYAIVNNDPKVGTVIGKALQVKTTDGEGVVEAVVGKH
jgi:hypothetical protein